MKTLEACYEQQFNKIPFLERKVRITHPKTILQGPPKCGKSYLIYDYLSNFENEAYLYIDFHDLRNDKQEIATHLKNFVKKHAIKVLVLENFEFEFEFPMCDSVIITTQQAKQLKRFKTLTLHALDFEEFVLHEQRHQNITNTFNQFFKYGNLPQTIQIEEFKKQTNLQEVISNFAQDGTQTEVLKLLFESLDEKKSLHALFKELKKSIKISKDRFYAMCEDFERRHIVYFVQKYNQSKATKKIYAYNHGFLTAVSHTKKFKSEFTNMLFLELKNKNEPIYYLEQIDFYLPKSKTLLFSIPFFNELILPSIKKKIANVQKEFEVKEIFIVTISNDSKINWEGQSIHVVPFYQWALS